MFLGLALIPTLLLGAVPAPEPPPKIEGRAAAEIPKLEEQVTVEAKEPLTFLVTASGKDLVCQDLADRYEGEKLIRKSPLRVWIGTRGIDTAQIDLQGSGAFLKKPIQQVVYIDLKNYRKRISGVGTHWTAEAKRIEARAQVLDETKEMLTKEPLAPGDRYVLAAVMSNTIQFISSENLAGALQAIDHLKADPSYKARTAEPSTNPARFIQELKLVLEKVSNPKYLTYLLLVGMELPNMEGEDEAFWRLVNEQDMLTGPDLGPIRELAAIIQEHGIVVASYNLCDAKGPQCSVWSKYEAPFPIEILGGHEYMSGGLGHAFRDMRATCLLQVYVPDMQRRRGVIKVIGAPRRVDLRWPAQTSNR
jgi:hypothetical protein